MKKGSTIALKAPSSQTVGPKTVFAQPHRELRTLQKVTEQNWITIGKLWDSLAHPSNALFALERALVIDNASVPALHSIGMLLDKNENHAQAVEYLVQAAQLQPENGEIWSQLGHAYLVTDNLEAAYQAYGKALQHLSDTRRENCKLWHDIGILWDRFGRLEDAQQVFIGVLQNNPDYEKANEIYFRLGIIYRQLSLTYKMPNLLDDALHCFNCIGDNPPSGLSKVDLLFQIGHIYELQGNFVTALDYYEQVRLVEPEHAKVLQQCGSLFVQWNRDAKDLDFGISLLQRSLSVSPKEAQTHCTLGTAYIRLKDYFTAFHHYLVAIELESNQMVPGGWSNTFVSAIETYEAACLHDADNPKLLQHLGWLYFNWNRFIGDAEAAASFMQRSLALDNADPLSHYFMGRIFTRLKNTNAAFAHYQVCFELGYDNVMLRCSIGVLFASINQTRQAFEFLESILAQNADIPEIWCNLAMLYEAASQYDDALEALRNVCYNGGPSQLVQSHITVLEASEPSRTIGLSKIQPLLPKDVSVVAAYAFIQLRPDNRHLMQACKSYLMQQAERAAANYRQQADVPASIVQGQSHTQPFNHGNIPATSQQTVSDINRGYHAMKKQSGMDYGITAHLQRQRSAQAAQIAQAEQAASANQTQNGQALEPPRQNPPQMGVQPRMSALEGLSRATRMSNADANYPQPSNVPRPNGPANDDQTRTSANIPSKPPLTKISGIDALLGLARASRRNEPTANASGESTPAERGDLTPQSMTSAKRERVIDSNVSGASFMPGGESEGIKRARVDAV